MVHTNVKIIEELKSFFGSNVSVVNKPEVLHHFGSADNQFGGVPMARVIQIHDVLNDLTICGNIFPKKLAKMQS